MIGLFFKWVLILFAVAVVIGMFVPEESFDKVTQYSIFTGAGGVCLGILIFIIGLFTGGTGRDTIYSYENLQGQTVHYVGPEVTITTSMTGIFIGVLSFVMCFLLPIGILAGAGIRGKFKKK